MSIVSFERSEATVNSLSRLGRNRLEDVDRLLGMNDLTERNTSAQSAIADPVTL